ncbi:MAG TPA: alpha-hydroxy-acid oxidizing protein [Phenylobacterium sp.]|uniref:alpha-hydroxy-acid oxidizing protein n=1 Tax=Phenylobacterium sp. TaxID=1871053 RepID=UPI002B48FA45|nr:alpha-hydroxy-acid oxidizing protein [Phenylobacterium sp.]HKR86983.1 alpha-hydroxy-acid oxidizing protein [Phenylobacterium sp.]
MRSSSNISAREHRLAERCLSHEDFRQAAKRALPRMVFDFVDGGAGDERAMARNIDAFARTLLLPRALQAVSERDQSVAPFGRRWNSPFAIAPMGLTGLVRPQGDLILARCARDAGIPFCLSTASTSSIEEASREMAGGDLWFQLYVLEQRCTNALVKRAADAGVSTLVLTVDVVVNGDRRRDARNGFALPLRLSPRLAASVAAHPRWLLRQVMHGFPKAVHFAGQALDIEAQMRLMRRELDPGFDWHALRRLRDQWKGTLIVKGLLRAEDVQRCHEAGIDGVILSNHGGRQLDEAPAPLDQLRSSAPPAGGVVLLDSGVRDGGDILKALALGAHGVLVGRPLLYALAAAGEAGVTHMLSLLRTQLDGRLALTGCARVRDADRGLLVDDAGSAPAAR